MARDVLEDDGRLQVVGGLLSPVSDQYRKAGLVAAAHRLEMCRLAVSDSVWINVDPWEAQQTSYQTTIQVLNSVQGRLPPGLQVMLLAGADLIKTFEVPGLWAAEDRQAILGQYGCVVVDRWNHDISEFLLADPILYKYRKSIHVVKQFISNDISSTKIR